MILKLRQSLRWELQRLLRILSLVGEIKKKDFVFQEESDSTIRIRIVEGLSPIPVTFDNVQDYVSVINQEQQDKVFFFISPTKLNILKERCSFRLKNCLNFRIIKLIPH